MAFMLNGLCVTYCSHYVVTFLLKAYGCQNMYSDTRHYNINLLMPGKIKKASVSISSYTYFNVIFFNQKF